jgi:phosphoglycolate phosphatase-like HAD superfamily hydrolase
VGVQGGGMSLKNRYDLFVFDLDGTLIDSKSDIARSANARDILPAL